ncbi:MAG: bifunctional ornithine acetyltransferase/N-acetylglutamate synthase [Candidatus Limnocylindrales bacterium]
MRPLEPLPSHLPEAEPVARLPRGFEALATAAGIKDSGAPDLAVVLVRDGPAAVAATFTSNRLPAAPVQMNRAHLAATAPEGGGRYGWVDAMMCTSGCANAATGPAGLADQRSLAATLATHAGTQPERVIAMSTGLIGTRLPLERVAGALASIGGSFRSDDAAFADVAEAMRTTDSVPKAASVMIELHTDDGGLVPVTVSGVAKGVGMIHPDMATMLSFVLTDARVQPATLSRLLRPVVARTWNQTSIDGDQSTNDTVLLVASGASGAAPVDDDPEALATLEVAVEAVARSLARQQAADGEGASTLITCAVSGGADDAAARAVARAVVSSDLLKAAVHGADPNWGRIAMAVGNATIAPASSLEAAGLSPAAAAARAGQPVELAPDALRIDIQGTPVFAGIPLEFDRVALSERMKGGTVTIRVDLGVGSGVGEAFGCDLTQEYVIENSEYST